jgi:mono/diheme cytochrome c family protein
MPGYAVAADGKEVFDNTCKQCHGADGNGSAVADAFFKTKVPRLPSDNVQMKTNKELKEIITGGKGQMDPVKLKNRPVAPHRKDLSEEEVDAVIAYVRTLPK